MKEENLHKDLESRLREAAKNLEVRPSEEVWVNIHAALHEEGIAVWSRNRWMPVAAGLALLLGLGICFGYFSFHKKNTDLSSAQQEIPKETLQDPKTVFSPERSGQQEVHPSSGQQPATFVPARKTSKKDPGNTLLSGSAQTQNSEEAGNEMVSELSRIPAGKAYPLGQTDYDITLYPPQNLIATNADHPESEYPQEDSSEESTGQKRLSLSIYFTPGISYRTFKEHHPSSGGPSYLPSDPGERPGMDAVPQAQPQPTPSKYLDQKPDWGWEVGTRIAFRILSSWNLQTGLKLRKNTYSATGYRQPPNLVFSDGRSLIASSAVANSSFSSFAVTRMQAESKETLKNKYIQIGIPLLVGYQVGQPGQPAFSLSTGVAVNYMLHSDPVIYSPVSGRYFSEKDFIRKFNTDYLLEAALDIPVNKNLGVSVGPTFQYQLASSYKNYRAVSEKPFFVGLKTALNIY